MNLVLKYLIYRSEFEVMIGNQHFYQLVCIYIYECILTENVFMKQFFRKSASHFKVAFDVAKWRLDVAGDNLNLSVNLVVYTSST